MPSIVFASLDVSVYTVPKLIIVEETARFTVKISQLIKTFVTSQKGEF